MVQIQRRIVKQTYMIKLIKSTFYNERETKRLLGAFIKRSQILSFGPKCQSFESKFSRWQERRHCVLLNSGSSANLAIVQALLNLGRLKKGDKVGFSAITWSTNVMPLIQLGLKPIPIDVELDTLNVSAKTLDDCMKKHTLKMVFLTNLLGFCDNIDKIQRLCKKNEIILIEDNCESMGTVYKGKKLGNYSLASTFSFYVGHHMSTIEGGAVCTDDEELETMVRLVRAHGWDRNLSFTKQDAIRSKFKVNSTFYSRYTFYDLGYNLRPTEITGFIGLQQLKYIDRVIKIREKNYHTFARAIYTDTDNFYTVRTDHIDFVSNFAFPVICKSQKIRDSLVEQCNGKIEIRPIVGGNMMMQPFFQKYFPKRLSNCPNAQLLHDQGLYFGNNPELTPKEKNAIISIFTQKNKKLTAITSKKKSVKLKNSKTPPSVRERLSHLSVLFRLFD
jgi:CDP-4-dehydro-6-deoxyglucose reductase, E1